ncbi:MAG: cation:proton antiporter [Candidatus Delongbacteria bacterium]|nr:cation:proton antiporter [Candidatus Delongbacteria bacterium]
MHEIKELTSIPILLILGTVIIVGFYIGNNMKYMKLPSLIGYMIFGVLLGPSLFDIMHDDIQQDLSFITDIALSFVALSIGLELKFSILKKLGKGIIYIILAESFSAFIVVFIVVYLFTDDIAMALIFGSIAPASAPAGTVAVIHEYKAKGTLTKALYAIVGFDDGLGIIIFGFAAAMAKYFLMTETGDTSGNMLAAMMFPLKEVFLSLLIGAVLAVIISLLARGVKKEGGLVILIFGFSFIACGLSELFHLSIILTNMILGMVIVNTQPHYIVQKFHERMILFMPLLFIMFFTLAGANLHVSALPSLGLLGVLYIIARSVGLVGGSRIGAMFGHVEDKIKKWVGLGILSQAGVAIGLALIVKYEFAGLGKVVNTVDGVNITSGDQLGSVVITTVTATCIFFEIIGPILTKIALTKAGEINAQE